MERATGPQPEAWPYPGTTGAKTLDPRVRPLAGPRAGLDPNCLRQNDSI